MAREVTTTIKCDICGKPGAEEWLLCLADRRWRIDLCTEEHGAMLLEMVNHAREETAGVGPTPVRTRSYERLVRGVPPDIPTGR